ncbi:MAG TPA: cell wall-binding repeat-containing protein, partial [Solirubrobacterales bacterium]|nr:cell wall-binding repeat-containing protein [Solirubrobacterales bacterium]
MKRERPINADLPEPKAPEREPAAKAEPKAPPPAPKPPAERKSKPKRPAKPKRQPRPLTPFLLAGLVLVAVAFILAAVLGGTGGSDEGVEKAAPTPAAAAGSASAGSGSASVEELGYPSFATNNTTRIGSADPATTAAAVALAVYPSRTASQRPEAVTLVGEDDWAGAIAASVLMAEPVRAPVLISGPEVTSEALAALQPQQTRRISGSSAAKEAAEIAALRDRLFGSPPSHIVVAPSSHPDLAMPAAAWAARSGDPVLFAGTNDLPAATAAALRRHTKVPVYVLGPSSAISSEVLRRIGGIAKRVKRVSGEDPVANAVAFARYGDGGFGWNVNDPGHGFILARGDSPLDAGATAALSGSGTWGPLLLTDSATKLPAELRSYFLDVKPGYTDNPTRAFYNHVWVIGDQEAIDLN